MSKKTLSLASYALLACACLSATGCISPSRGNSLGPLAVPVPLSPYFQKQQEDRYWEDKRYNNVPILGPLTPGAPTTGLDEPSDDQVMRALERARPTQGGLPLLHEVQRNNVRIVKEKIADYVDPPRVVPLIGPVQLHHVHFKCTVYFTEVTRVGWPVPYTTRNEDAMEVIYIDNNHFHMVGDPDFGMSATY